MKDVFLFVKYISFRMFLIFTALHCVATCWDWANADTIVDFWTAVDARLPVYLRCVNWLIMWAIEYIIDLMERGLANYKGKLPSWLVLMSHLLILIFIECIFFSLSTWIKVLMLPSFLIGGKTFGIFLHLMQWIITKIALRNSK